MKITLRAAGSIKSGPERELVDAYLARAQSMSRALGITAITEKEVNIRGAKSRAEETSLILCGQDTSDILIVLDERGKSFTSRQLARHLQNWRDQGERQIVFAIGGADGFAPERIPKGCVRYALGPQTWPHKLVRVMIAEQIYRALSILAKTPYHRD